MRPFPLVLPNGSNDPMNPCDDSSKVRLAVSNLQHFLFTQDVYVQGMRTLLFKFVSFGISLLLKCFTHTQFDFRCSKNANNQSNWHIITSFQSPKVRPPQLTLFGKINTHITKARRTQRLGSIKLFSL